jgi:hypothetical protein
MLVDTTRIDIGGDTKALDVDTSLFSWDRIVIDIRQWHAVGAAR